MSTKNNYEKCVRYPVAFAYVTTGKLPGEDRENTTALVVVEEQGGTCLGRRIIPWVADCEEDDEIAYRAFSDAIRQAAVELEARSLFKFYFQGQPHFSVSIAHDDEQGATLFQERTWRVD